MRVVRFYVRHFSSSSSSSSFLSFFFLLCNPVRSVFRAGPQRRVCEISVPRRTSTASLRDQLNIFSLYFVEATKGGRPPIFIISNHALFMHDTGQALIVSKSPPFTAAIVHLSIILSYTQGHRTQFSNSIQPGPRESTERTNFVTAAGFESKGLLACFVLYIFFLFLPRPVVGGQRMFLHVSNCVQSQGNKARHSQVAEGHAKL